MKIARSLIAVASLSLLASAASAKVIAFANSPANFSYATSGTYVPITSTGATVLSVSVAKAGRYVLSFSAECSTDAPAGNVGAWTEIDIEVNGVAVAPTVGTSDGFCSADGVAGFGGWVRPAVTTVVSLNAGANTVRVLGKYQAGATAGWISDTSLVIHQ